MPGHQPKGVPQKMHARPLDLRRKCDKAMILVPEQLQELGSERRCSGKELLVVSERIGAETLQPLNKG